MKARPVENIAGVKDGEEQSDLKIDTTSNSCLKKTEI